MKDLKFVPPVEQFSSFWGDWRNVTVIGVVKQVPIHNHNVFWGCCMSVKWWVKCCCCRLNWCSKGQVLRNHSHFGKCSVKLDFCFCIESTCLLAPHSTCSAQFQSSVFVVRQKKLTQVPEKPHRQLMFQWCCVYTRNADKSYTRKLCEHSTQKQKSSFSTKKNLYKQHPSVNWLECSFNGSIRLNINKKLQAPWLDCLTAAHWTWVWSKWKIQLHPLRLEVVFGKCVQDHDGQEIRKWGMVL